MDGGLGGEAVLRWPLAAADRAGLPAPRAEAALQGVNTSPTTQRCQCGRWLVRLLARTPMKPGTEVTWAGGELSSILLHDGIVLMADGGCKHPRSDFPVCGAGVVALSVAAGVPTVLFTIAIPLPDANSAQQAEFIAFWVCNTVAPKAVEVARRTGRQVGHSDLILLDSALCASVGRGSARLRSRRLVPLEGVSRELLAFQARPRRILHIPRTMNKLADMAATNACSITAALRDWTRPDGAWQLPAHITQVLSFRPKEQGETRYPELPRVTIGETTTPDDIDAGVWRDTVNRWLGLSPEVGREIVRWSWETPFFSAVAVFYATKVMGADRNPAGIALLNNWSKTIMNPANDTGEIRATREPGLLVWYAPSRNCVRGRQYVRAIGAQNIPRPLRALLYHATHIEYDIRSSFLTIFADLLDLPADSAIVSTRTRLEAARAWARRFGLTPQEAKSVFVAPMFAGGEDPLQGAGWYLLQAHRRDPARARLRNAGPPPPDAEDYTRGDYHAFCDEIIRLRGMAIRRLRALGIQCGTEEQALPSALFHGLETLEAEVIWRTVWLLRAEFGLFSHAVIHDAILVSTAVPHQAVHFAFARAAQAFGIPSLRLKATDLAEEAQQAEQVALAHGYKEGSPWAQRILGEQCPKATRSLTIHETRRCEPYSLARRR